MFCDPQASVEQLTKEKWELSAANTDLQQRLQQTVTMAHMQVLSQICFYFDENQGNLDPICEKASALKMCKNHFVFQISLIT